MTIFISHSTEDDNLADRFHTAFQTAGLKAWLDHQHGITYGDDWSDRIQTALNACEIGIFLMSRQALKSEWCKAEYQRIRRLKKTLYTVQLEDIPTEEIPIILDVFQRVDCSKDFDAGLNNLVAAILGKTALNPDDPTTLKIENRLSGNLPTYHLDIPLSGRAEDLKTLREMLNPTSKEGAKRLLVLMGIGGVGKTRLAVELAVTASEFKDGVIWHRIEDTSKELSLSYLLRDHLNLPHETELDEVWRILENRQVLIILDNAESCRDIPAYVRRLEHYPLNGGSRVLMTSRFQWKETRKFNYAYDLKAPSLEAAAQIAEDMANQQGVAEKLAGHESEFAEQARRHPRLIQYALGWLHDYPLTRVFKMLGELKGGDDVAEALDDILHRTVTQVKEQPNGEAAIADLYKLLVFRGGFTDEAAEAILENLDHISLLRRWNLLQFEHDRYDIDPLIQDTLELDTSVQPTHYDFYYALARKHDKAQDYWGLDVERENLDVAFEWAMGAGEYEKAYWFYNTCSFFLPNRGRFVQRQFWLEDVAEKLQNHPDEDLWATVQNSLGLMYWKMPTGNRLKNLRRAIAAYEAALLYWTSQSSPLDYALTQNNLGLAYWDLSKIEDREANLRRAIAAYEAALLYQTPQSTPLDYAMTQNNLGTAYVDLAKIEDRETNLRRAIAAYEATLLYRTPQSTPLDYAATQNNLGIAYRNLATIEEQEANLRRAIAAFEAALVYRTPQNAPLDYAATQNNLGNAYWNLATIEEQEANLRRAIAAYEAALVYWTPQSAPLSYAMTQRNLGIAQENLGNLKLAIEAWQQAEKYYRLMGYIQDADLMVEWIAYAEAKLGNAGDS